MTTERHDRIDGGPMRPTYEDPIGDQWRTRMSWSLLIAGVLHGSILGLWPGGSRTSPIPEPLIALDDPVWITPFEEGGDAGLAADAITVAGPVLPPAVEGAGMTTAPGAAAPIVVTGPGASDRGPGAGAEASLEDLLRRTGGSPTLAGSDLAGLEFQSLVDQGDSRLNELAGQGTPRTPGAGDPSATESGEFDPSSELDLALERLAGFSPEVALESSSSWVLIRNPREVERFMGEHSLRQENRVGAEGAVAVALWIDVRGSVEWAEVIQSSGREDLDRLALQLFNDVVRFRPARLAGVLMPMSAIFSVNFSFF